MRRRGCTTPRVACSTGMVLPRGWCPMCRRWGSPMSSCSRSPSTRSAAPGATSRWACSPRPRAMAHPKASHASSTAAIAKHRVVLDWFRLTSRPMPTARRFDGTVPVGLRPAARASPGLEHAHLNHGPQRSGRLIARALDVCSAPRRRLRVDAVDRAHPRLPRSRAVVPRHGGRENYETLAFLRRLTGHRRRMPGRHGDRRGIHGRPGLSAPGRGRPRFTTSGQG